MGLIRRLRTTIWRSRDARNFDEEVRFHLAERADELVRNGMKREEAEREAQRRFGSMTRAREQAIDADTLPWLHDFVTDVRYAVRTLGKSPGFTATAILQSKPAGTASRTLVVTSRVARQSGPIAR